MGLRHKHDGQICLPARPEFGSGPLHGGGKRDCQIRLRGNGGGAADAVLGGRAGEGGAIHGGRVLR